MHFNIKHIFQGDSEGEIKNKINYNFDQLLSFAVGPDGSQGPKGALGIPGPGGYKGETGATGLRGTIWYKQDISPNSPNPFDIWVDTSTSNYQVKSRTSSNIWSDTGYSLFNSPYFQSYVGIIGPAGATDKFAIGLRNISGLTAASTSLVISDKTLTVSNSNPNRSKVLIVTDTQTERPILDFAKTGSVTKNSPGFYWKNSSPSSSDFILKSKEGLEVFSLLGTVIDTYSASSFLFGNSASITSSGSITITGTGSFGFYSNVTIGTGGNFSINSSNLFLSSSIFSSQDPVIISTTSATSGAYVLNSVKNLPSGVTTSLSGIEILTDSTNDYSFEFRDLKNSPIFSGRPKGSVSSGKHSQLTFGSTGGATGGATGGPYFYHTRRVSEVKSNAIVNFTASQQTGNTTVSGSVVTVPNVYNLTSPTIWNSDHIVLTPTSYTVTNTTGYDRIYIWIPTATSNTLDGVYYSGSANTYRIFLNDNSITPEPRYIYGIVFNYFNRNSNGSISQQRRYIDFENVGGLNTRCQYVDITYLPIANLNNANPRVFWKTCNGVSGYISLTNNAPIGTVTYIPDISNISERINNTGGGGIS